MQSNATTTLDLDSARSCCDADHRSAEEDREDRERRQTGGLSLALEDRELWTRFQSITNEMIVTKNGRSVGKERIRWECEMRESDWGIVQR